jgi:hypothetical protein
VTSGAAEEKGSPRLILRRPGRDGNAVDQMVTPWMKTGRAVRRSASPSRSPAPQKKQERPASSCDALEETETQTLRRSKLYGAPPNFTLAHQTLRRPSKLYAAPPNITAARQTLGLPKDGWQQTRGLAAEPPPSCGSTTLSDAQLSGRHRPPRSRGARGSFLWQRPGRKRFRQALRRVPGAGRPTDE